MSKQETKQIFLTIIVLILTVIVVSGGTFAYWTWNSSEGENTSINITFDGANEGVNMVIEPEPMSKTGMYPTNDCDGPAALVGSVKVTITNNTGTKVKPKFKIKFKMPGIDGQRSAYINYAVTDPSLSGMTCATPLDSGAFVPYTSGGEWKHYPAADNTYLKNLGELFIVDPYSVEEHTYTLYVWLNSSYTFTNTGTTVSDPMQNNTLTVTWSDQSIVEQVK